MIQINTFYGFSRAALSVKKFNSLFLLVRLQILNLFMKDSSVLTASNKRFSYGKVNNNVRAQKTPKRKLYNTIKNVLHL